MYIRPSTLIRDISMSNELTPSSKPFVHDMWFATPFDHCPFFAGSSMIKYAEKGSRISTTKAYQLQEYDLLEPCTAGTRHQVKSKVRKLVGTIESRRMMSEAVE